MNTEDITIVLSVKDSMPYARLFLESAMKVFPGEHIKHNFLLFDGGSSDGTWEQIQTFLSSSSLAAKAISVNELPNLQKNQLKKILCKNDGLFTEWTWDFLLRHNYISSTTLTLFMHADIYFKKSGLLDFLLSKMNEDPNCIIVTQFDPGSFENGKTPRFDMPRFFPAVSLVKTQPWSRGNFAWERKRVFDRNKKYSILFDNGSQSFFRFFHSDIAGVFKYNIISENELEPFLEHLGYSWVLNKVDSIHNNHYDSESKKSLRRVFELLHRMENDYD